MDQAQNTSIDITLFLWLASAPCHCQSNFIFNENGDILRKCCDKKKNPCAIARVCRYVGVQKHYASCNDIYASMHFSGTCIVPNGGL